MQNLNEEIEKSKRIAIFSHVAPDADALCSCFALKNLIRNNFDAKIVDVFNDGPIGELYNQILRDEVINPQPQKAYDLAFVLDCPNLDRIGKCKEIASTAKNIINIDHHETNSKFGTTNIVS
ncbi:MAG: DHH family phosphoesterase, partial [Clostridia bacterium]|nr:DHH family phosphoesterase [Clostridia bacterium]